MRSVYAGVGALGRLIESHDASDQVLYLRCGVFAGAKSIGGSHARFSPGLARIVRVLRLGRGRSPLHRGGHRGTRVRFVHCLQTRELPLSWHRSTGTTSGTNKVLDRVPNPSVIALVRVRRRDGREDRNRCVQHAFTVFETFCCSCSPSRPRSHVPLKSSCDPSLQRVTSSVREISVGPNLELLPSGQLVPAETE